MTDTKDKRGFYTRALHAGFDPRQHNNARFVPMYQTSAYLFRDAEHAANLFTLQEPGYIYSRINNPTVDVFEQRMANLEGGTMAVAFASGMAAISSALLTFLRAGDEIVASAQLYGGTFNLFNVTFPKVGITTRFVDQNKLEAFSEAITDKTRAIFIETISNPNIDVADIEAIAKVAHENGLPLIVDNTVATPYLCNPLSWGADVVIHSASKYIGGHGSSIGGVVVAGGDFDWTTRFPAMEPYKEFPSPYAICLRVEMLRDYGGAMAPMNAMLFIQGCETLALRMERHSENALKVARWLESNPAVKYVNYCGLGQHRSFELAKKYLRGGCSSLLSFGLKNGKIAGQKLVNSVTMIHHLANLGDSKTLILHPASTSHEQVPDAVKDLAGTPEDLIRMSIGLENVEDILADLERGLESGR
jgi:O-acetylhomoserine (thiol)-lyase